MQWASFRLSVSKTHLSLYPLSLVSPPQCQVFAALLQSGQRWCTNIQLHSSGVFLPFGKILVSFNPSPKRSKRKRGNLTLVLNKTKTKQNSVRRGWNLTQRPTFRPSKLLQALGWQPRTLCLGPALIGVGGLAQESWPQVLAREVCG